ncbi:unnamed protein product [Spirodela intermedia]|uniref:Uncharacterized protein n=1 Tax=Spirodela intermedia TaxID=51605 RepID=A0A7I8IPF3_SPIIN|nr:unnamed protein product [Spirodela intermedia]CAA6659373.1 unnamed protein product [Spirodela intermedia]
MNRSNSEPSEASSEVCSQVASTLEPGGDDEYLPREALTGPLPLQHRRELHQSSSPQRRASAAVAPRVFSCNYCRRKFFSSQALGGTKTPTRGREPWRRRRSKLTPCSTARAAMAGRRCFLQEKGDGFFFPRSFAAAGVPPDHHRRPPPEELDLTLRL